MAIHLRFAPTATQLLEPFQEALTKLWVDPFQSPTVIVPNPALGRWLDLQLASADHGKFKSLMALRRTTLERFLWDALVPAPSIQRLDAGQLTQVICAVLADLDQMTPAEQKTLEPVHSYLKGANGMPDPVRRVQLAAQLAKLFQEYEFNRPSVWQPSLARFEPEGLDSKWRKGQDYFEGKVPEEQWQRLLYCKAIELLGEEWVSLPRLHIQRHESKNIDWKLESKHIMLFQLSKISHFHRNTLIELSQTPNVTVHVFLTNPCAEFWEDVREPSRRTSWKNTDGPEKSGISPRLAKDYIRAELPTEYDKPDHKLLQLWGRSGKEHIYLWCPSTDWDFEYFPPQQPNTQISLLGAVQRSLLARENEIQEIPEHAKEDHSLRIFAAPDQRREVELLRVQILEILEANPKLKLEKIVVYLTDPAKYLAPIQAVFGAYWPESPGRIPYSILGVPGSDSVYAQGVRALLALLDGHVDRASVFALLRNPIVQAGMRLEPESVAIWEHWADAMGIFRGFDRDSRMEVLGDAAELATDIHTFKHGLLRLLVGNLATQPLNLDSDAPIIPFRDWDTSEARLVACFVTAIDALQEHVARLKAMQSPLEGVTAVREFIEYWLPESKVNLGRYGTLEARLRADFLGALDEIGLQEKVCGRTILPWNELRPLVQDCLPSELAAESKAWVGGLTFAPLRQGFILPHQHIFVLGLDGDAFPGSVERTPFNLLHSSRIIGDSDKTRENRFCFLELMHAAQVSLTLSYRAKNMQKDEELQPSSSLLELEGWLGAKYPIRTSVPWIPYEYCDKPEQKSILDLEKKWSPGVAELDLVSKGLKYEKRYEQASKVSLPPLTGDVQASLYSFQTFLNNPFEYQLRHNLGLSDQDSAETSIASDEPLESSKVKLAALKKELLLKLLQGLLKLDQGTLEKAVDEVYANHQASGAAPEGLASKQEVQSLRDWGGKVFENLTTKISNEQSKLSLVKDYPLQHTVALLNGPHVSLRGKAFALLVNTTQQNDVWLIEATSKRKEDEKQRPHIDLWSKAILLGFSIESNVRIHIVQVSQDSGAVHVKVMKTKQENPQFWNKAQAWLVQCLQEMCVEGCAELLPYAIVKKLVDGSFPLDFSTVSQSTINQNLNAKDSAYRCFLEAYKLVDVAASGSDAELADAAQRRYELYLSGEMYE